MKILKVIFIFCCFAAITSCGNSQSTVENKTVKTLNDDTEGTLYDANRLDRATDTLKNNRSAANARNMNRTDNMDSDRMNNEVDKMDKEVIITNNKNMATDDVMDSKISSDQNQGYSELKTKDMFKYINMSDEQIKRYQRDYANYIEQMRDANIESEISTDDMMAQRDKNLKVILKPEQYKKYEQWKIDNPENK